MKKIMLDTNFLMAVNQFKIDIFSEIAQALRRVVPHNPEIAIGTVIGCRNDSQFGKPQPAACIAGFSQGAVAAMPRKDQRDTSQQPEDGYPKPQRDGRIVSDDHVPGYAGEHRGEEPEHESQRPNMPKYLHNPSFWR